MQPPSPDDPFAQLGDAAEEDADESGTGEGEESGGKNLYRGCPKAQKAVGSRAEGGAEPLGDVGKQ